MSFKMFLLIIIAGLSYSLSCFSDVHQIKNTCSEGSCVQSSCVVEKIEPQWHGPTSASILDFGPPAEIGYHIDASIINNSSYGTLIFAHDFNSAVTHDLNVFMFRPGCSQQVKFNVRSKERFHYYSYKIISKEARAVDEINYQKRSKGLEGIQLAIWQESFFKDESIDLGESNIKVCSKVIGSYKEETETYYLNILLEDCLQ